MKKYLSLSLVLYVLLFSSCSQHSIKPDSNITEEWIEAPYEDLNTKVSRKEANQFIDQFFDLVDQVSFDPNYRSADLSQIKKEVKSEINNSLILTKRDLLKSLNKKINEIKFSHLGVFNPEKFLDILQMAGMKKDQKAQPAVSAYMKNHIGIIKISSFLVPSITIDQIKAARSKVESAKYLIYDLRNNGGGSTSSVSYVIETILGPDKTFQFGRSRRGLSMIKPVVKYGYFDDESNFGSMADIKFEEQNQYVELKTNKDAVLDKRSTIVLINSKCGSSCDIFAAAIKESKAAKILGTKTAGQVLGTTAYKMNWKGYTALMPVTQVISPLGNLYEGIGIGPDYEVKSCEDPEDEECINKAIAYFK